MTATATPNVYLVHFQTNDLLLFCIQGNAVLYRPAIFDELDTHVDVLYESQYGNILTFGDRLYKDCSHSFFNIYRQGALRADFSDWIMTSLSDRFTMTNGEQQCCFRAVTNTYKFE